MSGIPIKYLGISFAVTFIISMVLMFFVFTRTVYFFFDVILFIIISLACFLGLTFMQWQLFEASYPIEVTIYELRSNNVFIAKDRAKKIMGEAGKYAYKLKSKNVKTKPVDFDYMQTGTRGQAYLEIYSPQANEYIPTKFDPKTQQHVSTSENARYWYSEQTRRNYERFAKKFGIDKYMPIISIAMVAVSIGILLYIFLGQMQNVIAQIGGIQQGNAELLKQVTEILKIVKPQLTSAIGSAISVPPPPV
jgi:hypothetical protein